MAMTSPGFWHRIALEDSMMNLISAAVTCLILSTSAYAQDAKVVAACANEFDRYCIGLAPTDPASLRCLMANSAELSPVCRAALFGEHSLAEPGDLLVPNSAAGGSGVSRNPAFIEQVQ
jgi:hypothetical protein